MSPAADTLASFLILAAVGLVVLGPMAFLLWRRTRRFFQAMIALRDRIDRSQRH